MNWRPMLASSAETSTIEQYLTNPSFLMQPKFDGDRLLVVVEDGNISALNRAGAAKVSNVSHPVLAQFAPFLKEQGTWVWDGEQVGQTFHCFDMAAIPGRIDNHTPFSERFTILAALHAIWKPDSDYVRLAETAGTEAEKRTMYQDAENMHREGVIIRHRNGLYEPARRSTKVTKVKFIHECDAIVTNVGTDGKENVTLSLLDPENNRVVEIGRASAIGKKPSPQIGDVWEVHFLNAGQIGQEDSPRLYQPRLMRRRNDEKDPSECVTAQLKGAFTDKVFAQTNRKEQ